MVKDETVSNNVTMKVGSSEGDSQKNHASYCPFNKDLYSEELYETYTKVLSLLKVIMIGCISECDTFFSEYKNYENVATILKSLKLINDEHIQSMTTFGKNTMNHWCELVIVLMVSLVAMPNDGGVECVKLYTPLSANDSIRENSHGTVLKFSTILDAYDWKEHILSLFIPDDPNKYRFMVMIDNEPIIITNKNAAN